MGVPVYSPDDGGIALEIVNDVISFWLRLKARAAIVFATCLIFGVSTLIGSCVRVCGQHRNRNNKSFNFHWRKGIPVSTPEGSSCSGPRPCIHRACLRACLGPCSSSTAGPQTKYTGGVKWHTCRHTLRSKVKEY